MLSSLDAEEEILVDDLPNFREGSTQFDVEAAAQQPADTDTSAVWDDSAVQYDMPDVIRSFIAFFYKQFKEGNVNEVHSIYETSFNKLTDRYYKSSLWPPAEAISPLVGGDKQFLLLYKELYYRHIYSKLQPTLEQRLASFSNYCDFFDMLLAAKDTPVKLALPNQWLWDMIDEFIYQFQTFCQYRSRVKNKSEDELKQLKENSASWSVQKVLSYLQALVDKSDIQPHLRGEKETSTFLESPTYKMLGYFSLVGLLRVHCLLADYRLALKCVEGIDLSRKGPAPHGLFARVTLCHITVFYYVGWAYLMSRRYTDAIKTFSNILFYIARTKQYHTRSYQYDQILKKNEQMYALLAVAASLCPQQSLDENLVHQLRDKYGDRMGRMQSNNVDVGAYEELFAFACPKFISPAPPSYDSLPPNYNPQEAYRLQLRLFMVSSTHPRDPTSGRPPCRGHGHSPSCTRPRPRPPPPPCVPPASFLSPAGRSVANQGSTMWPRIRPAAALYPPLPARLDAAPPATRAERAQPRPGRHSPSPF